MRELLIGLGFLLGGMIGILFGGKRLPRDQDGRRLPPFLILLAAILALAVGVVRLGGLAGALPNSPGSLSEKLQGGLFIAAVGLVAGAWLRAWLIEALQRQGSEAEHSGNPARIAAHWLRAVIFAPMVVAIFFSGLMIAFLAALRLAGGEAAMEMADTVEAFLSAQFMSLILLACGITFLAWHGQE